MGFIHIKDLSPCIDDFHQIPSTELLIVVVVYSINALYYVCELRNIDYNLLFSQK